jgi:hypothetical protein
MDGNEARVSGTFDVGFVVIADHHVGIGVEARFRRLEGSRVGLVRADAVGTDHRIEAVPEAVLSELRFLPLGHAVGNDPEAMALPEGIEQRPSLLTYRRRGELALPKYFDKGSRVYVGVGLVADCTHPGEIRLRFERREGFVERLVVRFDRSPDRAIESGVERPVEDRLVGDGELDNRPVEIEADGGGHHGRSPFQSRSDSATEADSGFDRLARFGRWGDVIDVLLDGGFLDANANGEVAKFVGIADGEVDDAPEGGLFLQAELELVSLSALEKAVPGGIEDLLFVEQLGETIERVGSPDDPFARPFDFGVRKEVRNRVGYTVGYLRGQHRGPNLHVDAIDHR